MVKVMLVDDHPVVREGLRTVIESAPDMDLVGEAGDGREALQMLAALRPQVMLVDLHLPDMSGLELIRHLRREWPSTAVVVLTVNDSHWSFTEALRAGACGYLLKDAAYDLIPLAIRAAAQGGSLIQQRLLAAHAQTLPAVSAPRSQLPELTAREADVLNLLAQGCKNRIISEQLHLAEVTVKKYVQSLIAKVGVEDRTQLAVLAARHGFGEDAEVAGPMPAPAH